MTRVAREVLTTAEESQPDADLRPSVLLVDDVEANLISLRALLEDMGCKLVLARSGNEALRWLLKSEFAVVLLDVQMPQMDGYEVARHARQNPNTRDVPIIFLTAAQHEEDGVLRGYGSGAVDFLFKPITPLILRSKVRIFLDLYRSRRQISEAKCELERTNTELQKVVDAKAALAEQFQSANQELATAYAELKRTHAQLVQSAKMASLGELVAGVAHEINNPLAFALSHLSTARRSLSQVQAELPAELLTRIREPWERAANRLQEMGVGLERIDELVIKLRTFSRLDEGEQKRVSVRACIDSILTILGYRLKDRVQVVTHFGEPDMLDCYPGPLNQAIMNLIANAIDAIAEKGVLTINAGAVGTDYVISVADTGSGIPEHLRERVMEPFFTTKPVGQGTGLGLSITYSIVRKHGGTLDLHEAPGGGTLATIRIPLSSK